MEKEGESEERKKVSYVYREEDVDKCNGKKDILRYFNKKEEKEKNYEGL